MKRFFNVLMIAIAGVIIASCGNPKKMAKEADQVSVQCNPQVLEVVAGKIRTNVTVSFPEKFFHPKAIIEVVPAIVYNGGESLLDPIMFQGEKVTENYEVIPETGTSVSKNLEFDYVEGMEKCHLELRLTVIYKEERVPFAEPYRVADGANTTYMLVRKCGTPAYIPDSYKEIIPEQNEAQILYLINSATVRGSQLTTKDIKDFQKFLKSLKEDERRELVNTEIVAYASPDGKEDFNAELSQKRAKSATDAFNKKINNKKVAIETEISSRNVEEDWDGFSELVANSDIQDKELILRVLQMYSDPAVREKEIKNLSQVYTVLQKEILPALRRARFIANINFTNYSNEELLALMNENIEVLDEEALLRVASLLEDNNAKINVYQQAVNKYSSERGLVNLAVAYLAAGENGKAEATLAKVTETSCPYFIHAQGVLALRKGEFAVAENCFKKAGLKESNIDLAVIDILNGNYNEALAKVKGTNTFNEALANVLTNNLMAASKILGDCQCPCSNYLKAIIAARNGKVAQANEALAIATKEEAFAKRAENDIEFAKIR